MKKGDYLILALLVISGFLWLLRDHLWPDVGDNLAIIQVAGEHYAALPMNINTQFKINFPHDKYMELTIENDSIWISRLTVFCPEKICVRTGKISRPGESIVCLPNKTVIYIKNSNQREVNDIDDISF